MGKLYVARHGETEANIEKAIVGVSESSLTEKGIQEAHTLGKSISSEIDMIVTSPMKRATMTSDIIRKYNEVPIVELPHLHPQNFGVIDGLTLDQIKNKGWDQFLHHSETDKYTHQVDGGETTEEMEHRTYQSILDLQEKAVSGSKNILLLTHNSILRCLKGNLEGQSPDQWIESHLDNICLYDFTNQGLKELQHKAPSTSCEDLINSHLGNCVGVKYGGELANDFARIVKGEEAAALAYLMKLFPQHPSAFINSFQHLLSNSITIKEAFHKLSEDCDVEGVKTILQFGSSVFGMNYSVGNQTDLDVELVIDESFNIKQLEKTVFKDYESGDIEEHFNDFIKSGADYFSFKTVYLNRPLDFRITRSECFDKICNSSLDEEDPYVMKEFRKEFRPNGIVPVRKNFSGKSQSWENEINYIPYGQIIQYPLFKYEGGQFVAGNNIDKYASIYDCSINEVETKKKIHKLRETFHQKFKQEQEKGLVSEDQDWTNIFLRKGRFPKYILSDIKSRYNDVVI